MKYLDLEQSILEKEGALHTAVEISGQPMLWQDVYELVGKQRNELKNFLLPLLENPALRIILTGAGSSAFIGEAAGGLVQAATRRLTQAIATTDLITHPGLYFLRDVPTLLVSFARSGNSPESVAAVELANEYCDNIYHLVISCNDKGSLATMQLSNALHLVLPKKSNDQSLAMTGSFTSMLLSVILAFRIEEWASLESSISSLRQKASALLQAASVIKAVAQHPYQRVVFLGSGPLLGIARECHLKLQELTDGQIICKHDSFLGFRHGPRAVVNKDSLIVYLFSENEYVLQYEKDLSASIDKDLQKTPVIISNGKPGIAKNAVLQLGVTDVATQGELDFIAVTLVGQLLGFYFSLAKGLQPDNPSVSGAINRVVQGVTIYPAPVTA